MRRGDRLGGYVLTTDAKEGGGHSQWAFAQRGGTEYFIKRFLAPTYPLPGAPGSEKTKAAKRERCEEFERHQKSVNNALAPLSGEGGNLVTTKAFFRSDAHYFKVTDKVDVSGIEPGHIAAMAPETRVMVMLTACHSLGTLHAAHLVHGDVKPPNVLIKPIGSNFVAKIIDFDNCFIERDPPPREQLVGDPAYYSPELLRYVVSGDGRDQLTAKSDVFALGLVFWQYLTAALPKLPRGSSYAAEAVMDGPLALRGGAKDNGIIELISTMLAPTPTDRPTMREVHGGLKRIRRSRPALAGGVREAFGGVLRGTLKPGTSVPGAAAFTDTSHSAPAPSPTADPEAPRLRGTLAKRRAAAESTDAAPSGGKLRGSLLKKRKKRRLTLGGAPWVCERCESVNPPGVPACETCAEDRDPDDVSGVSHARHLRLLSRRAIAWRVVGAGPHWVEVAAAAPEAAEAHAARLLGHELAADQAVMVASTSARGGLTYLRAEISPFPSTLSPGSAQGRRWAPVPVVRALAVLDTDRPYQGRVKWFSTSGGYGFIACTDRRVGDVFVQRATVGATLVSGQEVSFSLKKIATGYEVARVAAATT